MPKTLNMRQSNSSGIGRALFLVFIFILCSSIVHSQTDSLKVAPADTATKTKKAKEEKEKGKGWNDEFQVYAGASFNYLSLSSERFESTIAPGYLIGFGYKRGKFFYWQVGARYNNATYKLSDLTFPSDSTRYQDSVFSVRDIGIPITGGINFLSAVNRVVALRLFISAIPSYAFGVGENDIGLSKDDINNFNVYGQVGLGFNVAFLFLEAGFNYGFMDVLENYQSKPGQIFVHLGFRF